MYLKFSNFRGWTSAGGGQALVQKRGQVLDGGIGKIFAGWGGPLVPPRKKTPDTMGVGVEYPLGSQFHLSFPLSCSSSCIFQFTDAYKTLPSWEGMGGNSTITKDKMKQNWRKKGAC